MTFQETTQCYIERNGCYLMQHRVKKEKDFNKDKWIGIGGKFEPGEDALACAVREAMEETGLRLVSPVYRGVVDFYCPPEPPIRMHIFTCPEAGFEGDADNLPDCDEGTLEWVPIGKVTELPIWEGDEIFLRLLAQGAPFFHLDLYYDGDRLDRAILNGTEMQKEGEA